MKDLQIQVNGRNDNTVDNNPTLKLGGTLAALNVPLKIKAMKRRTVKLAVHKVFGLDEHGSQTSPANFPTKAALEEHLNKVYGRQVNTFFEATMYDEKGPNQTGIDFDFAIDDNDRKLSPALADPELNAATPNAKSEGEQASANIDVWVIGGGVKVILDGNPVYGVHYPGPGIGKVIIDGDLTGDSISAEEAEKLMLHTFAHEIGHVMTDDGHPDKGDCSAVLKWKAQPYSGIYAADVRDKSRLMCSGSNANFSNPGTQLVKREWDSINAWLKSKKIGETPE